MARNVRRPGPILGGLALVLLACVSEAHAHQHWLDLDSFYPAPGDTDSVYVRGGHYFPKTAQPASEKVMQGVTVHTPSGETIAVEVVAGDKEWRGVLRPQEEGVHLIALTLKPARAPKPKYEAKTILVAGPGGDSADRYALGSGLELIPGKPVSALRPGDELPVSLSLDGVAVEAELEVVPEKGRSVLTRVSADEPAVLHLKSAGRYLVTATIKGRDCSLVLYVTAGEEAGE